ncbi:MAG: hypothetical protein ACTSRK_07435 [Promethearchaeota archaeon]
MKRHNSKNNKIIGMFILGVCLTGFLASEIGLASADPSQSDLDRLYSDKILHFYGEGVINPLNVSYDALLDGTYTTFRDIPYLFLNRVNTTYNLTITGVSLADILQTNNILRENATYVQFVGVDGAKSFYFPLRIILADVKNVLIVTEEDGAAPDDGPLKIAVFMEGIVNDPEMIQYFQENCAPGEDFVHNSKYAWKWLTAIRISTKDSILQTPIDDEPSDDTDDEPLDDTDDGNLSNSIPGFPCLMSISLASMVVLMIKNRKLETNH